MEGFDEKSDVPLSVKSTPQNLDEFVGQKKILSPDSALYSLIRADKLVSCVFYGPPGSGKTALAKIIARSTGSETIRLNAVTARVDDLRKLFGKNTLLFIDEIHRFNKMVQDGLLPALEEGTVTLIGTTTKNPYFYLIPPLRSRILLFEFEKLTAEELLTILKNAEKRAGFQVEDSAGKYLVVFANGDARRLFNILDAAITMAGNAVIDRQLIEKIIKKQPVLYDRDENYHYDTISAFIKSIRGSDPDAALYWLALMIEGGEDPLFIARRLVILASEDIGLADPLALVLAESCFESIERVGMPEAQIILSHVTLYLALQPKSNSSYMAIHKAREYIKTHSGSDVPEHLRSTPPPDAHYAYPHDFPYHFVNQKYVNEEVRFYEPGEIGNEKELKRRLEFLRKLKREGGK
jgi:putative ATPase